MHPSCVKVRKKFIFQANEVGQMLASTEKPHLFINEKMRFLNELT